MNPLNHHIGQRQVIDRRLLFTLRHPLKPDRCDVLAGRHIRQQRSQRPIRRHRDRKRRERRLPGASSTPTAAQVDQVADVEIKPRNLKPPIVMGVL